MLILITSDCFVSFCSSFSEKRRQSCSAGVWEDLLPRSGGARGNSNAVYTQLPVYWVHLDKNEQFRNKSYLHQGYNVETILKSLPNWILNLEAVVL